jgi:hypothetical protein
MRLQRHVASERVLQRDVGGMFYLAVILLVATLVAFG